MRPFIVKVMPKVGFEPTRGYPHYALNVARLPVPPLRLNFSKDYTSIVWLRQLESCKEKTLS